MPDARCPYRQGMPCLNPCLKPCLNPLFILLIMKNFTLFLFYFCCFSNFLNAQKANKRFTVVIDAGHGGKDSGALGKKTKEKDITLKISLLLGEYIQEYLPEVKVVYTRKTDIFLELYERAEIANNAKADVFLSIHCNSLLKPTEKILGSETFVMGLHTAEENLEVAKRENSVILLENNYQRHYNGYDPNSPEAHIMLSMYQNAYLKQSLLLAENIENQLTSRSKRPSRGVKQAGFMVLRATAMPSALVETGFLSHSQDEIYIASEQGQAYIAAALYRALRDYINNVHTPRAAEAVFATAENPYPKAPANLNPKAPTPNKPAPEVLAERPKSAKTFRIQLASSPTPLDIKNNRLKVVPKLYEEQHAGRHKYTTEEVETQAAAQELLKHWKAQGFTDAFVVQYLNGKRI